MIKKSRIYKSLMISTLMLTLYGCGYTHGPIRNYVHVEALQNRSMNIAILPFENFTTHRNAGMIMTQLTATELMNQGLFKIMEDSELRKWLLQKQINPAHLEETTYAQKLGKMLGVEAVLLGSVTEFGYQHGLKEEPTVGVNLRLIHAETGQVLWSASYSEVGHGILAPDSVNGTAQRVLMRVVSNLNQQLTRFKKSYKYSKVS
jgi:polysaccharide biosynthesis protein PelC